MTQFVPPARMLAAEGRLGAIEDLGMEVFSPAVAALSSAPPGSVAQLVTTQEGYGVRFVGMVDVTRDLILNFTGPPEAPVSVINAATGGGLFVGTVRSGITVTGLPGGAVVVVRFGDVAGYVAPLPQSTVLSDDLTLLDFAYSSPVRVTYDEDGYFVVHGTSHVIDPDGYLRLPELPASTDTDGYAVWEVFA